MSHRVQEVKGSKKRANVAHGVQHELVEQATDQR